MEVLKSSPIGWIRIFEENGCIVRLELNARSGEPEEPRMLLLCETCRQLDEYFAGKRRAFDLPLAPAGSRFRRAVWAELERIPYGKVVTYRDVAIAVGNPRAARAGGMANHCNPIPILIPCHRVVGSNGALTGYAGGLEIKRKLLQLEAGNGVF